MAGLRDELNTNYIQVSAADTVAAVYGMLGGQQAERSYRYVVWPADGAQFIVVRWNEIEQIGAANPQATLDSPIGALAGLPAPVAAIEIDSMGLRQARELRDEQPGRRLVVLANGAVVGLLTREYYAADGATADPFARGAAGRPRVLIDDAPSKRGQPQGLPRTTPAEAAPTGAAPDDEAAPDTRVINGWVDGVSDTMPMQVFVPYELKFDVDQPRADAQLIVGGGGALGTNIKRYAAGKKLVKILITLDPGDFTLYGVDTQEIVVPTEPNIASRNTITFTIEASKTGPNTLNAIIYINGNLFQRVKLTAQVGEQLPRGAEAVSTEARGLTFTSAAALPERPQGQTVNVVIINQGNGYQILVQGGGVARARLNITENALADWVKNARETLFNIVHMQNAAGEAVYQNDSTTIDEISHKEAMKQLASAGALLFDNLFRNNLDVNAQNMGKLLTSLSRQNQLNIQIVAERFFFPWAFIFDGDDDDLENPSPEHFWGLKHVIEYLPEFSVGDLVNFVPTISVGDTVDVAFVCNNTIDSDFTEFDPPLVRRQREFLRGLPGVSVSDYPTTTDLLKLLRGPDSPPLIYFYCHALSMQTGEEGGTDYSRISLSDGRLTLAEAKQKTRSAAEPLRQAPLVFLNACESAELSPFLYDGWVPFLLLRGARGVLGTEVETPAAFGAEFGQEFLKRFTAGGQPVGKLLRDLRMEYATKKNNIMGLLYALYSNGEVAIARGA
ncbi:CHAT domain-containing protein [Kouleothrix sp.]|uniref:CHAT domain-containing protein n=1 Tax=Kouleothrix sp. TaxID=2779161 RepID=UPI00391AE9C1